MDAVLGDDAYRYPDHLLINAAKGGPGGKPGCGSPDVAKNWPVRQLIANTGYGTGLDWRPNPGIGFPATPTTRRSPGRCPNRPVDPPPRRPGDWPRPLPRRPPPYGAPQYGPDGTPLYPGVPLASTPAATPPGA